MCDYNIDYVFLDKLQIRRPHTKTPPAFTEGAAVLLWVSVSLQFERFYLAHNVQYCPVARLKNRYYLVLPLEVIRFPDK